MASPADSADPQSPQQQARLDARRRVLDACGASPDDRDALLAYGAGMTSRADCAALTFPLQDEPHLARWTAYEQDAREPGVGAFEALRRRFVQLRFPIASGMSQEDAYRRATLRGQFEAADDFAPGLTLAAPHTLTLTLEATIAGHIPVIVTGPREDFATLARALTERNEPAAVPPSMGACIVSGLNNWDRVARHRAQWESELPAAERPDDADALDEAWKAEFRVLATQKALYQDRCIILSRGPYSAVSAQDAGLPEAEWLERSLVIRREHECTHYFTWRVFGAMRNNLLDELIADFVGIVRGFGTYRPELALRCLGMENPDRYRPGGRLENYRGTPPLSDAAFGVLQRLAVRGVRNLDALSRLRAGDLANLAALARLTCALFSCTLEEIAAEQMPHAVSASLPARTG
jgi:hypothetical protein